MTKNSFSLGKLLVFGTITFIAWVVQMVLITLTLYISDNVFIVLLFLWWFAGIIMSFTLGNKLRRATSSRITQLDGSIILLILLIAGFLGFGTSVYIAYYLTLQNL